MLNTGDKKVRITLRLNEDQFSFVKKSSDVYGVSPSEFLRMVINMTMAMEASNSPEQQMIESKLEKALGSASVGL